MSDTVQQTRRKTDEAKRRPRSTLRMPAGPDYWPAPSTSRPSTRPADDRSTNGGDESPARGERAQRV